MNPCVEIGSLQERVGRPAEVRFEMRISVQPGARRRNSAESHAPRAQDDFERILRASERRSRAPLVLQRGAQVRRLGTHTIVANCIHVRFSSAR
jgi:hypothetical protein